MSLDNTNEIAMKQHEQWLMRNDEYLRNAIQWVHLRLQKQIDSTTPKKIPETVPKQQTSWNGWFKAKAPEPDATVLAKVVDDAEIKAIAEKMRAVEAIIPPPALSILTQTFGLTHFERDLLMLCVAMELDSATVALCAKAQNNSSKSYPSFALAANIFDEHRWDALSADRPLRYWRLLEINQPGAEPLTTSALRADERIVNYIVEPKHIIDDRLMPFISTLEVSQMGEDTLSPTQRQTVETLYQYLHTRVGEKKQGPNIMQLVGVDAMAKQAVARQTLARLGLQMVKFSIEALPTHTVELENLSRLWARERQLLPLAIYVDATNIETSASQNNTVASLQRFIYSAGGIVIVATRDIHQTLNGFVLEVNRPSPAEQQAAWCSALGSDTNPFAARLAGQFNLNIPNIQQIAATEITHYETAYAETIHHENANDEITHDEIVHDETTHDATAGGTEDVSAVDEAMQERIWQACLLKTTPNLDQLAQRIDAKATWEHLVLPQESLTLLHQIVDQVNQRGKVYNEWGYFNKTNRGLGLSVLFAGESGTGKTMSAEVIANALGLNLYRIDLSSVVSKYIGETEKNLRKLFDAAEEGGAVLFFDEADALFGKRSEVKDSHDRYANIETNYLLQRIESYSGLAILATNMKSALDQAFMRRLRFIIKFPFPGVAERSLMWQKAFPDGVPKATLDYDRLARFNLTGGSIYNIALNASFLAAAQKVEEPKVTMPIIFDAIRSEMRKLDKPINEAEFRMMEMVGNS